MDNLIFPITLSNSNRNLFEDIQWKAWETAIKLNPNAKKCGFNINSTYQCEIYPEHDNSPKEEWESGDLTWDNFIRDFPEYTAFLDKHHFYHGCTMISRAVEGAHRHGNGELTFTYPLQSCNNLQVFMVTPTNEEDKQKSWLNHGEQTKIDLVHRCKDGHPFMLKANHFHKTSEPPIFKNGDTIITVWHSILSNDSMHYSSIVRMMNLLQY